MTAVTILSILCLGLAILALCLWIYANGVHADYEEACADADYYYQLAGNLSTELETLKEKHEP